MEMWLGDGAGARTILNFLKVKMKFNNRLATRLMGSLRPCLFSFKKDDAKIGTAGIIFLFLYKINRNGRYNARVPLFL